MLTDPALGIRVCGATPDLVMDGYDYRSAAPESTGKWVFVSET